MKKILFVCHGNICRSPMAEFVMKDLVEKAGLSGQFEIASAATSTEEIGNPVYPPARRKLAEHGICCAGKTARQMTRRDYETYDYLIAMDRNNLRNMVRFVGSDPEHKVSLLMDHTSRPGDVADRGTQGILKPHGRMCWRAAPPCWKSCDKRERG
jgi:protein-tyrosine phosphatase